jgi:hypothetical protein
LPSLRATRISIVILFFTSLYFSVVLMKMFLRDMHVLSLPQKIVFTSLNVSFIFVNSGLRG